jgi:hypothetical protein
MNKQRLRPICSLDRPAGKALFRLRAIKPLLDLPGLQRKAVAVAVADPLFRAEQDGPVGESTSKKLTQNP